MEPRPKLKKTAKLPSLSTVLKWSKTTDWCHLLHNRWLLIPVIMSIITKWPKQIKSESYCQCCL